MNLVQVQFSRLFFSLTLLTVGLVTAQAQVDWMPLRIDDNKKATAYFPGAIEEITDTVATTLGEVPFTTYFVKDDEAKSGNRMYMLTVIDYEEGSFPKDSTKRRVAFFEETVDAAAEAIQGQVLISQPIEDAFYPGWVFRIDFGEEIKRVVRNRMFLVGDRYYHLQIFSFGKDQGEKSRTRFFDSFQAVEIL